MMKIFHLLIVVLATANIDTSESDCGKRVDFAIVVDSSFSVCNTTEPCTRWKDLVRSMPIGSKETRVAFVTISDTTNVEWHFDKYANKESVLAAIDNVPYRGGELKDIVSVSKFITDVFNPVRARGKSGTVNKGVLITDGAKNFGDDLYILESIAIQSVCGVEMFVVCEQPGCHEYCAKGVASPIVSLTSKENKTYFLIDDYLSIDEVTEPLVRNICAAKKGAFFK